MEPQRTFTPHGAPIRDAKLLPVQPPTKVIGRNRELGSMHVTLKVGSSIFLSGAPGIGKTALASVLATAYIASNPGGVLWFNVVEDDFDLLVARTGRAYGVNALATQDSETLDPSDNMMMVRALLEKNHPLIVLDGMIDVDAARDYVRQCAAGIPTIIANEETGAGPWTPLELGPLTPDDSAALFKECSLLRDSLYDADIEGLSKFLNGIPLAIELAGRQVIADDLMPAELLSALPSSTGQDGQLIMMAVVFKRLKPPVQAMLLVLAAMFTGGATAELISDLSDVPAQSIIPLMRELVARGLARESVVYGQFAYTLHEVTQSYARAWLDQYQRLQGTETRALMAVIKYTERHAHNTPAHHDRLAAEMENIVGAAAYATSTNQVALFRRLNQALTQKAGDFIASRGFQPEMHELIKLSTLLGTPAVVSAQSAAQPTQPVQPAQAPSSQPSTQPEAQPETPSAPSSEVAAEAAPAVEAPVAESDQSSRAVETQIMPPIPPIGPGQQAVEVPAVAEAEVSQVSEISEVTQPSQPGVSGAEKRETQPAIEEPPLDSEATPVKLIVPRPALPPDMVAAGATQGAEPHTPSLDETQPANIEQLLTVRSRAAAAESTDESTAETAAETVAAAPAAIPEPPTNPEDTDIPTDRSIPTLEKQLSDAQSQGDTATEARLLHTLGQYYGEQGQRAQAQTYHKQALEAYESLDDVDGMLVTLDALAALAAWADDAENALLYASRGVNLAQRLGDNTRLGRLQSRLGDVRLAIGDLPGATEAYTQAVESLRTTEDWLSIGVVMGKLGNAYLEQHKPKEAIMMLDQSLTIFQKEQRVENIQDTLASMGAAYGEMQQWDKAQAYSEQALTVARQNADAFGEAKDLGALGRAHKVQGDRAGAVELYRQALHVAFQVDNTDLQAEFAFELGSMLSDDMNMLNLALQLLRESDGLVPNGDARRMMERARKRMERAVAAGVNIPAATQSSQEYAAQAYEGQPG